MPFLLSIRACKPANKHCREINTMSLMTILKNVLLKRPIIIGLSLVVFMVVAFGLHFHLLAILFSALLFASGYLVNPPTQSRS